MFRGREKWRVGLSRNIRQVAEMKMEVAPYKHTVAMD